MTKANKHNAGFTLTELMISMSILVIVSLLGYIVLTTSLDAARLTDGQAELQASLRDVMQQISTEVRSAYTPRIVTALNTEIPVGTVSISVATDGRSITFEKPVPQTTSAVPLPSTPITIGLQCEDAGFSNGNCKLDSGEDANGDGVLNRRINRTQDGATKAIGASNDICEAQFQLLASQDAGDTIKTTLLVRLVASRLVGAKQRMLKVDLESRIHLEN